jgi:hypothetical protein
MAVAHETRRLQRIAARIRRYAEVASQYIGTRLRRAGGPTAVLLAVLIGIIGILASLVQLATLGGIWIVLAIVASAAILLLVFLGAQPLLRKNFRSVWMFRVVEQTGLLDVENRSDKRHRLPPPKIFQQNSTGTIMLSGILDQVFQNYWQDVERFLNRGGHVRVLLLHPEVVANSLQQTWPQHNQEWLSYWLTNCNEAEVALDAILWRGLDQSPRFEIKFMTELPPYFGTFVGGSFSVNAAEASESAECYVRVQPLTFSRYVGRGTVITFRPVANSTDSPYEYFLTDLINQWQVASDDGQLIARRKAHLGVTGEKASSDVSEGASTASLP